jgi:hypothetical protein
MKKINVLLTTLFIVSVLCCSALGQETVHEQIIKVIIEPVEYVDVIDTSSNVTIDSILYTDNTYEIFYRAYGTTDSVSVGAISDTVDIIDLGAMGTGTWEFGYRAIGTNLEPGDIRWSIEDNWFINYIPSEFIIRKIRKGNFIGFTIIKGN